MRLTAISGSAITMQRPVISLLTDFGLRDHFVGVMKAVILSICPEAEIVDITHDLSPMAISDGALLLGCSYPYFLPGSIHVAVVDPGVGGARRALAARCDDRFFVGPDNGILSYAFADAKDYQAVAITNSKYCLSPTSATFHGRDVFAPAAAHLANGTPLEELGPAVVDPVLLDLPEPRETERGLEAHVLHVDRFGNLITDLKQHRLAEWLGSCDRRQVVIEAGQARLEGLQDHYETVAQGRPLAVIGSTGRLEIAVNRGSASDQLRLTQGDTIVLRKKASR
jgi:S-adenosylmethionine hydrolase